MQQVFTRVLDATTPDALRFSAAEAAACLRAGQVVGLPTETVYGLGADATNPLACAAIFEAKERPLADPLIVHVGGISCAERLARVCPLGLRLMEAYWPGPLTLVMPRRDSVPDIVTGGQPTVAIRHSAHPVFDAILREFDGPVAAPSANRFGRISPTQAVHVVSELGGRVPLIIDAGPCEHGLESTIVEVSTGALRILRRGPVTAEALAEWAPVIEPDTKVPVTPGSMKSHYAPRTPLEIVRDGVWMAMAPDDRTDCALLLPGRDVVATGFRCVAILSESGDPREMAANLYASMRRLDDCGAARILAVPVDETGIGAAIMERLRKAASRE